MLVSGLLYKSVVSCEFSKIMLTSRKGMFVLETVCSNWMLGLRLLQ